MADAATTDAAPLALRSGPDPDPAVLAAITAAVQLTWPRPGAPGEELLVQNAWRFSGRWWNKPVAISRDRPWTRR